MKEIIVFKISFLYWEIHYSSTHAREHTINMRLDPGISEEKK